ncbi:hypothetical protein KAR91_05040 [Candidatus Pacearchaeota archaeon]|nr:hypothetical protein [Candidatus Pacearchaeota archaeon]
MIGSTYDITAGGKTYTFEYKDNNTALEINAAMMMLIHQAKLDDDEEINNVTLSRGFKGEVLREIKELIMRCSHTPKLTDDTIKTKENGEKEFIDGTYKKLEVMSIPIIFLSLYNKHIKAAEDKKKEQTKSSDTQLQTSEKNTE